MILEKNNTMMRVERANQQHRMASVGSCTDRDLDSMEDPTFSAAAWRRNLPLYEKIRDMPFNQELLQGVLAIERFRHYIIQDAHYLVGFAQALAVAAVKSDHPDHIVQFADAAAGAIVVERELHANYFRQFGISTETVDCAPISPACHHYIAFLIATGFREPLAVHLAALLPCFWIYREIGRYIHRRATADNPYRAWIDTYAGTEFEAAVDTMITTTDKIAERQTESLYVQMHAAFTRATQLEWIFWHSAYCQEEWPV
jgi:thiaminase/transcriptional activator TenA